MKQYLPYNVLLVVSVALTGLMIFYNLQLRDTFAVAVAYRMPAIPQPQPAVEEVPLSSGDEEIEADEWADYDRDAYDEEKTLTSVTFPLDINRATEDELRFIPRVGNVTAQRIIQYRDVLGRYTSLDQLKEIKGIGGATFENIAAYLIIAEEDPQPPEDSASGENEEDGYMNKP